MKIQWYYNKFSLVYRKRHWRVNCIIAAIGNDICF